jgi:hypothetical protein
MARGLKGKIPVVRKPLLMFFSDNAFCKAVDTHFAKTSFDTPLDLFRSTHTSRSRRKACLKGLKHDTSNGCMACDVCKGRVKRSSPTLPAIFTTSMVTCEPWPSRISKWRHEGEMPNPHSRTFFYKKSYP